jgi:hypothetical protein
MANNNDPIFKEDKLDAFKLLFGDLNILKEAAIHGQLENTNLRTLAWMIFLKCIPINKSEWKTSIDLNRSFYEKIKAKTCSDPSENENDFSACSRDQEILLDYHPLSSDPNNKWTRYFIEKEKKSLIFQDVMRM